MAKHRFSLLLALPLALTLGCKTNCEQLADLVEECNAEAGLGAADGISIACTDDEADDAIAACLIEEWDTMDCSSDTLLLEIGELMVACDPDTETDTTDSGE